MITKIHLVRHGAVDNPNHIYYGREYNYPLSPEGREQAAAAGALLAERPIAAIFHSPLLRTTQTAQIVQSKRSQPISIAPHPDLLEVHSALDGMPLVELEARNWDLYTDAPPQYEQPADLIRRIESFFTQIAENHRGQEVIAVTHGDIVAFSWLWAHERPITLEEKQNLIALGITDDYPFTASISTFSFDGPPVTPKTLPTYRNPMH